MTNIKKQTKKIQSIKHSIGTICLFKNILKCGHLKNYQVESSGKLKAWGNCKHGLIINVVYISVFA